MFDRYRIPLDEWIRMFVDWLVGNYRPVFQNLKWPVEYVLDSISELLLWLPPSVVLLALFGIAWAVANWRIGLFSVAAFAFVGFIGLWDELMVTFAMVLSAVTFCVVVGIPMGIFAAHNDWFYRILRPVLDAFQTTPAFVYLVPVVMLFSIGTVPGVISTIIFALPPIVRLTNLGIRQVPEDVVEAGQAFGCTPMQLLWKIELPLALPTIMAGLNQTIMLALSMVVIAALIGAQGLGVVVFSGLNRLRVGDAAVGGIGIVLLAMVLDRITQEMSRRAEAQRTRSW